MTPTCHDCGRTLREGESAWADDWKVVDATGVRLEVRYTCEECAARPVQAAGRVR